MHDKQTKGGTRDEQTQAARIFAKFGGTGKLCQALAEVGAERERSAVYKWSYPKDKGGTGGFVPSSAILDVKRAARYAGVLLTDADWAP